MSNHSPEYDKAMQDRLAEHAKAFERKALAPYETPGPTGKFPQGKLTPTDEGEIKIAIGSVDGKVVVDFGKPVAWIGFDPERARAVADALLKHANEIDPK
jgi:hypothetical protein